ncbi:unnamed protein product, partial [Symbiodinium sp. CCMP2592]
MQASIFNLSQQKRELEESVAQGMLGQEVGQLDINRTEALLQHMQKEINGQRTSLEQWEQSQEIPLERFDQRLPLAVQQDRTERKKPGGDKPVNATFTGATCLAWEGILEIEDGYSAVVCESKAAAHGNISQVRVLSNKCEKMRELLHLAALYEHELAAMPAWAKVQTAQFEQSTADTFLVELSSREQLQGQGPGAESDRQCSKIACNKDVSKSSVSASRSNTASRAPVAGHLSKESLALIRSKIKSAAYVGPKQGYDVIFKRFDKDGSGTLCFHEVRGALRRILRIPPSSLNDYQISSLCATLDTNASGNVDIAELVSFLGTESLEGRHGLLKEKLNQDLGLSK